MKNFLCTFCAITFMFITGHAQEKIEKKTKKAVFATKIVQNSVAGFSPIFFGGFETDLGFDITVYSIFWTNTSFGNPGSGGDQLLETGVGIGLRSSNGNLFVNPGVGFAHGKFFSDYAGTGEGGTKIAEAVIPNMYLAYQNDIFDLETYFAYYKSIRGDSASNSRDLLLFWAAPGFKIGNRVVLGGFFEELAFMNFEDTVEKRKNVQVYRYLGGSIKLKLDNGIAFRFSAGPNLTSDIGAADEFYKVSAFIPL